MGKNGKSSVARRAYGIVEIGFPGPTFYPRERTRQFKKCLRPFRAYIQDVGNFTGRCPVLLLMPLQGMDFHVIVCPDRAQALAQGIALRIRLRDQTKALKGRKQLIKSLS
jgi:hypothetical protein